MFIFLFTSVCFVIFPCYYHFSNFGVSRSPSKHTSNHAAARLVYRVVSHTWADVATLITLQIQFKLALFSYTSVCTGQHRRISPTSWSTRLTSGPGDASVPLPH